MPIYGMLLKTHQLKALRIIASMNTTSYKFLYIIISITYSIYILPNNTGHGWMECACHLI